MPETPAPNGTTVTKSQGESRRTGGDLPRWEMSKGASIISAVASVILGGISLLLGVRYILNVRFMDAYANGTYDASVPYTLTYLNFPDPYLPYHNFGCATFMGGNYDAAAGTFAEALANDPPHDEPYPSRECQVRINLALALTRPLKLDSWRSEAERQELIRILTTARNYLTEDGCANPAKDVFDGHSEDAEQLKKDIDKALEKLNDPNGGGGDGDNSDNQDEEDEKDGRSSSDDQGEQNESRLKDRLNNRKSEAMQDRAEEQQSWDDLQGISESGSSGDGSQTGADGQSGKTW